MFRSRIARAAAAAAAAVLAASAAVTAAAVTSPPQASAAKACVPHWTWADAAGNSWKFTRCSGLITVVRDGGPLGACTLTYPFGDHWEGPDDLCAYSGPH